MFKEETLAKRLDSVELQCNYNCSVSAGQPVTADDVIVIPKVSPSITSYIMVISLDFPSHYVVQLISGHSQVLAVHPGDVARYTYTLYIKLTKIHKRWLQVSDYCNCTVKISTTEDWL